MRSEAKYAHAYASIDGLGSVKIVTAVCALAGMLSLAIASYMVP